MVFAGVVEPSWADAHVDFAREPLLSVLHTPLGFGVVLRLVLIVHGPVSLACPALLVADPADRGHGTAEDHDILIVLAEHLRGGLIAVVALGVDLTRGVCTAVPAVTAVGAVEPVFEELAILRRELLDLLVEDLLILGLTVVLAIAVPWGEVEAEEQAVLAARLAELADEVALPILPRAVLHRVLGGLRGPEAEAVVVLGGEDDALHAGALERAHPLLGVEALGGEGLSGSIAIAPLEVVEGVEAEVHEGVSLQLLPLDLGACRDGVDWGGCFALCRAPNGEAEGEE